MDRESLLKQITDTETLLSDLKLQLIKSDQDAKFYMFSEEHGLMCRGSGDGSYWVYNGSWEGTRKGDEFTVEMTGSVSNITDWRKVYRKDLSEDEKFRWYLPTDYEEESRRKSSEYYNSILDDDVAF